MNYFYFSTLIAIIIFVAVGNLHGVSGKSSSYQSEWVTSQPDFWTDEKMNNAIPKTGNNIFYKYKDENNNNQNENRDLQRRLDCADAETELLTQLFQYNQDPIFKTVGKVYFQSGTQEYVCSAAIAENKHLVWTAAHCVYDVAMQSFMQNWLFVPQYFNKSRPLGTYQAVRLHAPTIYIETGKENYDYALAEFDAAFPDSFGGLPLMTNIDNPANTTYTVISYPAAQPFNGEMVNLCTSVACARDVGVGMPQPIGLTCDSTAGSSGGPFIVDGHIAGVVDYSYPTDNNGLYSAYFDDVAQFFYDDVVNDTLTYHGSAASTLSSPLLSLLHTLLF